MTDITQTNETNAAPLQAYAVLAMGIIAVSFAAILIKLAQEAGVPSLVIAMARLTLAAIILTPLTLRRHWAEIRKLTRPDFVLLIIAGVFLAMHFAGWVSSIEYTSILISTVIVTTTPIWVGLAEVVLLRARLSRGVVIGLMIAIVGGLLIAASGNAQAAEGQNDLLGAGLALFGALAVTVYVIIGRKLRPRLSLLPYIWIVYSIAALTMTGVITLAGLPITGFSTDAYFWLILLALIPQLIGHSSLNYALGYLPATYVSLSTQLEPIFSAALAFFIFTEIPGEWQIIGSIIILIGVTIATLNPHRLPRLRWRTATDGAADGV